MEMYITYIIYFIIAIFIFFIAFLVALKSKIKQLEYQISLSFHKRNCLLPSIYEISKNKLVKHEQVFEEIIKLKKIDFSEKNINKSLFERINTQTLIHNEFNFIFKIFNKHPKLHKEEKFIYITELIYKQSLNISQKIKLYKKIIEQFNYYIRLKQFTIIGILIPISKIEPI